MARIRIKKQLGKQMVKPILHQDRGSQYTSHDYVSKALGWTTLSYSSPGAPTHNPNQESFFGRFKDQWKTEIAEIQTFEELERFVEGKINYYNYQKEAH